MSAWKYLLTFLLITVTVCVFATGYNTYDRYPIIEEHYPCYCSSFGVGAELIWWCPCIDDLDFALVMNNDLGSDTSGTSAGNYRYLKHDFEPGFRLFTHVDNATCFWDYRGSYTYICDSDSRSASAPSGGSVLSTLFHGGFNFDVDSITAKHHYRYQTFDALILYSLDCNPCQHFRPFAGVEGMCLERMLRSQLSHSVSGDTGRYEWKSKYRGIGLKAGTEYFWGDDCCRFFARASGTLLVGELEGKSQHVSTIVSPSSTTDLKLHYCECIFVPGYHLAAGVRIDTRWCNGTYAEVGYEFMRWHNVPTIRRFQNNHQDIGLATSASGATFGFHGLFFGFGIVF